MRTAQLPRLARFVGVALSAVGCTSQTTGDVPANLGVAPPVAGREERIKDVTDPALPGHAERVGKVQSVSGAIVLAVDSYDETQNGRGTGTIYVQDLGSSDPYSGISLFAPAFNPGNLRVSPGDVLDLRGEFQENTQIGTTAVFPPGSVLPQLAQPLATFRYETKVPEPRDIDLADLSDYTLGRRWVGMLVRVKDVTLQADASASMTGRLAVDLTPRDPSAENKCESPFPKPASLVNDLFPVERLGLKRGTKLKTVVGIMSFFCNLKIAPRSEADLQL